MPVVKLTQKVIAKATYEEGPDYRDTQIRGLILRPQPPRKDGGATKSYFVQYGRGKRLKLGDASLITLTRARNLARDALGVAADGRDPREALRPKSSGLTLNEFLSVDEKAVEQRYGYWVKISRKTGAATLDRIKTQFDPTMGQRLLTDLTPSVVERWRTARIAAGRKPETVNRDVTALRAALSKAVEWKIIPEHPFGNLKPLKVDTRKVSQRALTVAEEKSLVTALEEREERRRAERDSGNEWRVSRDYEQYPSLHGRFTDYLYPAVVLSLNTGLRRNELFSLKWRDVDFDALVLTVRGEEAKDEETREIPLNAEAMKVFRQLKLQSGNAKAPSLVFPGTQGRLGNLKKSFYRVLVTAGIDRTAGSRGKIVWHSLRHTFGTRAAKGASPHVVKELMGHAHLTTTERYFHAEADERRAAVDRLAEQ